MRHPEPYNPGIKTFWEILDPDPHIINTVRCPAPPPLGSLGNSDCQIAEGENLLRQ